MGTGWTGSESQIQVIDVMTRKGLRAVAEVEEGLTGSSLSRRHILEGMSALLAGHGRVTAWSSPRRRAARSPTGTSAPVSGTRRWRRPQGIRRFPPRIMRHTAASWLVQDGVPLYDVQALLGHEDYATTQRYAHLAPDAHSRVIESWSRRRDASVTHRPVRKDAR